MNEQTNKWTIGRTDTYGDRLNTFTKTAKHLPTVLDVIQYENMINLQQNLSFTYLLVMLDVVASRLLGGEHFVKSVKIVTWHHCACSTFETTLLCFRIAQIDQGTLLS